MEYLEQTKGNHKLDTQWKAIKNIEYEENNALFYLDTEYADSRLIEVAIINAAGEEILNTLVIHEKLWKEIFNEGADATRLMMTKQKQKFQWDSDWVFPSSAKVMDAAQVATCLERASCSSPGARFVEYSRGNMDIKKLHDFLQASGFEHVLGGHKGYGAFLQWQKRLPGFWDCSQETVFTFTRPGDPLAETSHRALVDAKKLRLLMQDLFHDSAV